MDLSAGSEFLAAITIETVSVMGGDTVNHTASHPRGQLAMKGQRVEISIIDLANATPMSVQRIRIVSRVEPGDAISDAAYVARRHPDEELPVGNHIVER